MNELACVMEVLFPLMRNEIQTSLFLPAGQVFILCCKEKVTLNTSGITVEKRPRTKGSSNIYTRGGGLCSLGVYCSTVTSPHPPGGCLTLGTGCRM